MYSKKITLRDGKQLLTRCWLNKESNADIVIIHGFLEHSGRYGEEANFFMDQGLSVFSYDQRGHGLSDGLKSYISNFDTLVDDLSEVLEDTAVGKRRPYYYFAHSMGGLVLLSYLLLKSPPDPLLKGVILSAPFLMPDPNLAPLLQKVAGFIGRFLPLIRTVGADPEFISRDPQTVKQYVEDPHVDKKAAYARSAYQMLKQMKKLKPLYPALKLPFIVMHGTDDRLSAIEGSRYLYDQSESKDKSFKKFENFRHEITRELDKDLVFNAIKKWLNTHRA
jgi:alpha-beta hydrolase superfamily lysophospholipase